jgi:hypothetical protein
LVPLAGLHLTIETFEAVAVCCCEEAALREGRDGVDPDQDKKTVNATT